MSLNPLNYSISMLNKLSLKQGRLLIAEPFMNDPYFKRSVVLLTEHKKEGSLGFILNQPLNISINDTLKDFPIFDAPIFMGGPVQTDSLFYIHTQGDIITESEYIIDNLYWSGNFNQLKEMVANQQIFPHEVMFFIGYSGWDYLQIKDEVKNNSWIISDLNKFSITDFKQQHFWKSALQKMGTQYSMLSNFPEDPSFN